MVFGEAKQALPEPQPALEERFDDAPLADAPTAG